MTACVFGSLGLLPQRVFEFFPVVAHGFVNFTLGSAFDVEPVYVFHPQPAGTLHTAASGIGSGRAGVVGQHDGFPVGTADGCGDDVAQLEISVCQRMIGAALVVDVLLQAAGLGGHGVQAQEPVAPVDVQIGHDGAKLMGGVQLGVPVEIVPCPFVVFLHGIRHSPQVVFVSALTVDEFAEQPLLDHVQHSHFFPVVAAVFHQHAGHAGFFVGAYQIPALLDGLCGANFKTGILSGFHGGNGNLYMVVPVGGDENSFGTVVPVDHFFPVHGTEYFMTVFFGAHGPAFFHPVFMLVAYGGDLYVFHFQEFTKPPGTASAQTDDAHFYVSHIVSSC